MVINIRQRSLNTRGPTREKETFQNDKRVNSTERYKFKISVYTIELQNICSTYHRCKGDIEEPKIISKGIEVSV